MAEFFFFFLIYPQNLCHFENVAIKCLKQFLNYIEFICRRACEKNSSSNVMYLDVFLKNVLRSKFWNHFQAEIIPESLLFLDIVIVLHLVLQNQESWELWLDGFWGNRHSKKRKISGRIFFHFWAAIMYLLTALRY